MSQSKSTSSQPHKPLIEFDQWAELARSDAQAFETKRSETIEKMIQRMPEHKQQRMRCLQWKIDQVRRRSGTPMAACIKISEMMWDSLLGSGGLRDALKRLGEDQPAPRPEARVLNFPPPH